MPYLDRLRRVLGKQLKQENKLTGQSGCSDVLIKGNFVALESDEEKIIHEKVLCSLFNDKEKGYTQKNDWVVFGESKVLICEMKTFNEYDFKNQLLNGKLLVDFILQKMRLNENGNKPNNRIKYKYVLFSKNPSKLVGGKPRGTYNRDLKGELFELTCGAEYLLDDF